MRGLGIALSILLVVTAMAPVAVSDEPRDPTAPCPSPSAAVTMQTIVLPYAEVPDVHACLATPASGTTEVDKLVVIAHGLGWTVQAGWLDHMALIVETAEDTAVVATNYRDNFGFPAVRGAEDLVRATQAAKAELPELETTVLLGVSMGGAVSGTAIHIAPTMNGGQGLFDHWVDAEGVTNLFETYAEARAVGIGIPFAADVADGIERDAGGTPAEVPEAYTARSPAMNAEAMAAAGLQDAIVIHSVNDGLVPYDQAREMVDAFVAAGIPVQLETVLRGPVDQTAGTTPTSHALPADQDPNEQHLHLAGHASEADGDHPIMAIALQRVLELLDGSHAPTGYAERIHDQGTELSLPTTG